MSKRGVRPRVSRERCAGVDVAEEHVGRVRREGIVHRTPRLAYPSRGASPAACAPPRSLRPPSPGKTPTFRQALEEFRQGKEELIPLEVFNPPVRSGEAIMGPKGGAGPALPAEGGDGDCVDFVLTLGGDGLLMYSNTLFRVSREASPCQGMRALALALALARRSSWLE